jgi:hypothetical protein
MNIVGHQTNVKGFFKFFEKSEDKSVPRERDQLVGAVSNLDADFISELVQNGNGSPDHAH